MTYDGQAREELECRVDEPVFAAVLDDGRIGREARDDRVDRAVDGLRVGGRHGGWCCYWRQPCVLGRGYHIGEPWLVRCVALYTDDHDRARWQKRAGRTGKCKI